MTSADDLRRAVEVVERTTEEVWTQASRVSKAAIALRDAMDASADELGRTQQELDARRAEIEDEVRRARTNADAALHAIREEITSERARLSELERQHAGLASEVAALAEAKDLMLAQLAHAREQTSQVLTVMEDVLRAKDTLQALVRSFDQDVQPDDEADWHGRPIGRTMDLGGEER